ncbi:hypothetical protein SBC1_71880 (plasmid) [Caballeronia sp. SBC1]|nr:hypothetical protein SBC1_71880 [Caballeronia sp. SBC1]
MSPALPRRISSSIIRYVPGEGYDPLGRWSKKRRVSRTAEHAMLLVHEFGRFGGNGGVSQDANKGEL